MAVPVHGVGDLIEVNLTGLQPVSMSDVVIDPEATDDWHLAHVQAVLGNGLYVLRVRPLVGTIEIPPVDVARLRPRTHP